jgi:hypothetical protein
MDFRAVEKILGAPLPKSAHDYQAWWANDASHSQAKAWLAAGWQTENLNLAGQTVEFVRIRNSRRTPPVATTAPGIDPWGALAGTVTIIDETALTAPGGEVWDAERDGA